MKCIIAGGRDFDDYELVKSICEDRGITEVVSGGARGADTKGELFARSHDIKLSIFPALWKAHGRAAGPIRNKLMAEYADKAIVFWDGKSRGSKNMIETMKKLGKPVEVVFYDNT